MEELTPQMIEIINMHLKLARIKHPCFAKTSFLGATAVFEEAKELMFAVKFESRQRQQLEALDVIVTALRHYLGESDDLTGFDVY